MQIPIRMLFDRNLKICQKINYIQIIKTICIITGAKCFQQIIEKIAILRKFLRFWIYCFENYYTK